MAEKNGHGKIVSDNGMKTCVCGPNCTCGCGHRMLHIVLWWILGIIVLFGVFLMGVAAGHLGDRVRSMYMNNSDYGYPAMHGGYYNSVYGTDGAIPPTPMNSTSTSTTPSTSVQ